MSWATPTARSVSLRELAQFNPAAPFLRQDEEVAFIPMVAVSELGTVTKPEFVTVAELKSGYCYMQPGDVLVAKITPCFENNKIAVADFDCCHGFGSTEFHVIRPDAMTLDRRYVFHFLRQDEIRRAGEQRMTGSAGQRRVPRQFLEELSVPLPPLDEQRRIAAILDQADELRRKRHQALTRLRAFGQALFTKMFGNPLSSPRWPEARFGEVGQLDRGVSKHRPRNDPALLGGPYPLIQTGDVANCDGRIFSHSSSYSELGLKQSKLWPIGTLCITIAANIGKTGILTFAACFPDSVVGFSPSGKVTAEYVQQWLYFIQPRLEEVAPQFAQKNINLAILRDLSIPVPPIDLQNRFAAGVAEIDKLKAHHRTHLQKLDALFASLQHRAFRGEL